MSSFLIKKLDISEKYFIMYGIYNFATSCEVSSATSNF
jgi:hypothetical protein